MFTDSCVGLRLSCSPLTRNSRVMRSRKVPTKSRGAEGNSGPTMGRGEQTHECTSLSCSEPLEKVASPQLPRKSVTVVSGSPAGQTEEAAPDQIRCLLVAEVSSIGLDPASASPAS